MKLVPHYHREHLSFDGPDWVCNIVVLEVLLCQGRRREMSFASVKKVYHDSKKIHKSSSLFFMFFELCSGKNCSVEHLI